MKVKKKSVKEVLAEHECEIPGNDLGRTGIYMCFTLLLLFLTTDNLIFAIEENALRSFQNVSFFILGLCLFLTLYSSIAVIWTATTMTDELEGYYSLYKGKIALMVSVVLFFVVISLWFIILGGIVSSPFASLLTISPILLTIQCIRDRPINYDRILWAIKPHLSGKAAVGISHHDFIKRLILILGILPVFVIGSTVTVGEALIVKIKIHEKLTLNKFESIVQTAWYLRVYIAVYFISIAIAVFGMTPQRITRKITKKLFL
jgi:hypothetical protein